MSFGSYIRNLICLFFAVLPSIQCKETPDAALMKSLLQGYDNRAIPREGDSSLQISLGFTLVQLHSLDEKNQMLTSSGWFQVEWNDYRLTWNSSLYNRTSVVIPSRELWLPDIGFLNSASIYHSSMIKNEFRCVVYEDGSVLWVPGGTYYTTCELDISNFPFDKQMCYLHLTNWAYNIQEMNLTTTGKAIAMDTYKVSAEWEIMRTEVKREEVKYECCGNVSYPSLYYYIWIERKSLYYVVNIIIPCIILSLLANFTFCVPPASGEKVSLGITLLLSFTVFQLIVAESIPRRSDSVPVISLYISLITGVVTASIISTIFISHLHHKGAVPLPRLIRILTFDLLARLVLLNSLRLKHGTDSSLSLNNRLPVHSSNGWNRKLSAVRLKLLSGVTPTTESEMFDESPSSEGTKDNRNINNAMMQTLELKLDAIVSTLHTYERRRIEKDNILEMKAEWHAAAQVYDRIFFLIYAIAMVAVTVKFLVPDPLSDKSVDQWGIKFQP